jgi:ABC-type spermidine/putrescine transport system permease subunit I
MAPLGKVRRLGEQSVYVLMALPAVLLLLIVFIYPLLAIFKLSFFDPTFTLRHWERFFTGESYVTVLINTFKIALITTGICLTLGYPVAYLLSQASPRSRNLLMMPVLIPYFTSFLVRTFAWIVVLGGSGVVNGLLIKFGLVKFPVKLIFNAFAVYVSMAQILLVFMILPIYGVMAGIDKNLPKAAQNLGASPFQAFVKVFLPLSMPGVISGSLMVFILALGFYVTPRLLGGPKETMLSMLIETTVLRFGLDWGFAGVEALVLTGCTLFFVVAFRRYLRFEAIAGRGAR